MEWRCEWCGKPHEEDDPPCDNCGHGSFEKAVVPQTDLSEGEGPDATTVWVCTECGRNHTKHAPPCSRCGNHKLVKEKQRVDDAELSAPGYLDLLTPKYLAGLVVVLGLAGVFTLGVTGLVYIPGLSPGVPPVPDAPGEADAAAGRSLAAVESAYVTELNERRSGAGLAELTRTDRLDEIAAYTNKQLVAVEYGEADSVDREAVTEEVRAACGDVAVSPSRINLDRTSGLDGTDTAQSLAVALVDRHESADGFARADGALVGVDVHVAPDGRTYLTQFTC